MIKLKLENFSTGYKNKIIIDSINLSINEGEWFGIIGANGSGKSTLIKGICRIIKPQKGKVFLKGKDINNLSNKSISQQISFLPQGINPNLSISVSDLVALGRSPYKNFWALRCRSKGFFDKSTLWHAQFEWPNWNIFANVASSGSRTYCF